MPNNIDEQSRSVYGLGRGAVAIVICLAARERSVAKYTATFAEIERVIGPTCWRDHVIEALSKGYVKRDWGRNPVTYGLTPLGRQKAREWCGPGERAAGAAAE